MTETTPNPPQQDAPGGGRLAKVSERLKILSSQRREDPRYIGLEQDATTGDLFAPVYKCARKCGNLAVWTVAGRHICNACKEAQERNDALKAQYTRQIAYNARHFIPRD